MVEGSPSLPEGPRLPGRLSPEGIHFISEDG